LAEMAHWLVSWWKVFICSLLFGAGCIITIYCYWFNKGQNMQPSFIRKSCPYLYPWHL
jgi:hypothetical protein